MEPLEVTPAERRALTAALELFAAEWEGFEHVAPPRWAEDVRLLRDLIDGLQPELTPQQATIAKLIEYAGGDPVYTRDTPDGGIEVLILGPTGLDAAVAYRDGSSIPSITRTFTLTEES